MEQKIGRGVSLGEKDNRGFSLVELVIVLAIIAVLGAAAYYSLMLMAGQYARECAVNLNAVLEKEKNYALTKSASVDCYVEIVKQNNSYFARYYIPQSAVADGTDAGGDGADWLLAEEKNIGKSRVDITYKIGTGTETALDDDTSVKFVYDRISGAMKAIVDSDGTEPAESGGLRRGQLPQAGAPGMHALNGEEVLITLLNGKKYEIKIYTATGKHTLSRVD